jgi:hypothetical protein
MKEALTKVGIYTASIVLAVMVLYLLMGLFKKPCSCNGGGNGMPMAAPDMYPS